MGRTRRTESPGEPVLSTRIALILALALLALGVLQWRLHAVSPPERSRAPLERVPSAPDELERTLEEGEAEEIVEPVLEIPEYVPAKITERPHMPVEFEAPVFELDLGVPRVEGAVDEGPEDGLDETGPPSQ